ncbi:hypothetical protein BpHYR1_012214 [Brachionus plicatilis]|uniref:Uncharacterized protein n=1 Tax=Brachionus plicatilis TaxID=10195 RepID=A0A3M7PMX7_BRAPC|nr:hypothetical protein BpHYR1_012214 [Brachionus plicatilis]
MKIDQFIHFSHYILIHSLNASRLKNFLKFIYATNHIELAENLNCFKMSLTREAIKRIALSNTKNDALNLLRQNITPNYKIRSDLWRHEIFLNIICDLVNHCLKKGFTIDQCLACSHFFENLLSLIRKPSSKLPSLVDHIMEHLKKLSPKFSNKSLQEFIDYLNITILTHFNLYKYVFCFDRDDNSLVVKNDFHFPSIPTPDADSKNVKPYETWLYEQKIKSLDQKEVEIKKNFENKRSELMQEEENALKLIDFIKNDAYGANKPLDEDAMKKLIDITSIPVIDAAKNLLKCDLNEVKEKIYNSKQKQEIIKAESSMSAVVEAQKAKQSDSITPKGKKNLYKLTKNNNLFKKLKKKVFILKMINTESDDDFYSDDEDAVAPCFSSKQIALEFDKHLDK